MPGTLTACYPRCYPGLDPPRIAGRASTFLNLWQTGLMRGRRGGSSARSCSSIGTVVLELVPLTAQGRCQRALTIFHPSRVRTNCRYST